MADSKDTPHSVECYGASVITASDVQAMLDALTLERVRQVLRTFYEAPLSAASLRPVLQLATDLCPDLDPSRCLGTIEMRAQA